MKTVASVFAALVCALALNQVNSICPTNTFEKNKTYCAPLASEYMTHTADRLSYTCKDGSTGTYGLSRIPSSCDKYTFSSIFGGANQACGAFSSATLVEGVSSVYGTSGNAGWCVSCLVAGNCPGAWSILDLDAVQGVAGLLVTGRSGPKNYVTSLNIMHSVDGVAWLDVDDGRVFQTNQQNYGATNTCFDQAVLSKPVSVLRFNSVVMARYIKVFPLTRDGCNSIENTYAAYKGWYMCMSYEALGVSELRSSLLLSYQFSNSTHLLLNKGIVGGMNLIGDGSHSNTLLNNGIKLNPSQYVQSESFIDLSSITEFTMTIWLNYNTYSCQEPMFSLVKEDGTLYYSITPCYGSSLCRVYLAGNSINGYGWGQNSLKKNFIVLHGRKSGVKNYIFTGQRDANSVLMSNGMSGYYEFFNVEWPGKLHIRIGTPRHKHIIYVHDIQLFRDGATTRSVEDDVMPHQEFPYSKEFCASCDPGYYCNNNEKHACIPNSMSKRGATNSLDCVCNPGYLLTNGACVACKPNHFCLNQTSEIPCSTICEGFAYQISRCTASSDITCHACPSTYVANTPQECVCPANYFNNGTGCQQCVQNAVSNPGSYGLSSCTCIYPFSTSYVLNLTSGLNEMRCTNCPANTYPIIGTEVCDQAPNNTQMSTEAPGFTCPDGSWLPMKVPLNISAQNQAVHKPGVLYWDFEDGHMMNQWGSNSTKNAVRPRLYPDNTTTDISNYSPKVNCKFGNKCALICGTSSNQQKTMFEMKNMNMPPEGLSISFWIRIQQCTDCSFYSSVGNKYMWRFAGVLAQHMGNTEYGLGLQYKFNERSTGNTGIMGSATYYTQFESYRNAWHHHLYIFEPNGLFSIYHDGSLIVDKFNYQVAFPSVFNGQFFEECYFSTLIDDFAIFKGNMRQNVGQLMNQPAYLVFDGKIGLSNQCIPCPGMGMFCQNNRYFKCPADKNSTDNAKSIQECYCEQPGFSANGTTPCATKTCDRNWFCNGKGIAPQKCPSNTISNQSSTVLQHCTCPYPFQWDASGICTCPTIVNNMQNNICSCGQGFTGSAVESIPNQNMEMDLTFKCGTKESPINCTFVAGKSWYSEEYMKAYGSQYGANNLFDRSLCTSTGIIAARSPTTTIVGNSYSDVFPGTPGIFDIDLGEPYMITSILYGLIECNSDPQYTSRRFYNMSIYTSIDSKNYRMIYQIFPAVNTMSTTEYTTAVTKLNQYVRYIRVVGWSYPEVNYGFLRMSEFLVKGLKPNFSCSICPSGFYCPTSDIQDKQVCPPGHYCPIGSAQPIPCDIGMYSEGSGNSVCKWCPSLYSKTLAVGASKLNSCVCLDGLYGRADPTFQTLDQYLVKQNPSTVTYSTSNEAIYEQNHVSRIWNVNDPVPYFYAASTCARPMYIQYDMGATYAIGKIYLQFRKASAFTVCGFHIKISNSSAFNGEEINVVSCSNHSSCPRFELTPNSYYLDKWYNFPLVIGRYVRWYWGDDPQYLRMYVYVCTGSYCSPCRTCPMNSVVIDQICKCLPGFYLLYASCAPCTAGYTSILGSTSPSQCFPIGFNDISSNNMIQKGVTASKNGVLSVYGNVDALSDGTANNNEHKTNTGLFYNYVYSSLGFDCTSGWNENPKTRSAVRIDYDMGSLGYLSWIYARTTTGWGGCMYSFRISDTGIFNLEDTELYACGFVKNEYCNSSLVGANGGYNFTLVTPMITRYIRWWMGAPGVNNQNYRALQFRVGFKPLSPCQKNHYCTNTIMTRCPGRKITLNVSGGLSTADCICPPNTLFEQLNEKDHGDCYCREGFYWHNNQCNACPEGQSAPKGSSSILNCSCQKGKYPQNQDDLSTCVNCTTNHYCPLGAKIPLPCPPGWITSGTGLTSCDVMCPVGHYCPGNAMQIPCATGHFAELPGHVICTPCPSGFYCPHNLSHAIPCPTLNFCPLASIAPQVCGERLYSCPQSVSCNILCPPGGFCPGNGTIIQCPLGYYSKGGAAHNCTMCEAGFYCDSTLQLSIAGCA